MFDKDLSSHHFSLHARKMAFQACHLLPLLSLTLLGSAYWHHLSPDPFSRRSFPDSFVFGTSTSAYQVEGAASEGGRGPSIWDTFTQKRPDMVSDRSNGDVAIELFRLVQRYQQTSAGLEPYVTIFHWDVPQALEDEYESFLSPQILDDFKNYADLCFKLFGDRVMHWITLNEPWAFSRMAYSLGTFAPGRCSAWIGDQCKIGDSGHEPYIVAHHQLLAHAITAKTGEGDVDGDAF